MAVFGYARVSTLDQNLDTQLDVLQKHGVDRVFEDKITGTSESRPGLDHMLSLLRPGDVVAVAWFYRFGRDRNHLVTLMSDFARQDIYFRALDLGVDSSTPAGRMVLQFFAALAEYDKHNVNERARHGIMLAKAKGTHMGRPKGVDQENYDKVKMACRKKLSINETVALTGVSVSSVKRYRKLIEGETQAPAAV